METRFLQGKVCFPDGREVLHPSEESSAETKVFSGEGITTVPGTALQESTLDTISYGGNGGLTCCRKADCRRYRVSRKAG